MKHSALSTPKRVPAKDATTAIARSETDATSVVWETCRIASSRRIVSRLTASAMTKPRRVGRAARAARARFMAHTVLRQGLRGLDPLRGRRPYSRLMSSTDATSHVVGLASIEAARERLAGRITRTPLLTSSTAARWTEAAVRAGTGEDVRLGEGRLFLKAEHLQRTGSFKARGMTNRILTLDPRARARG